MIRVFVVDDQELVRTGCKLVIDSQDDMTVVGEAADGVEMLDRLAATTADVVLVDVRMPRLDGVEATRRLLTRPGTSPYVLVLTTFDQDDYVHAALRAGASGFLVKDCQAEEMLAGIRAVAAGEAVLAHSTTRRLIDHVVADLPDQPGDTSVLDALTAREREVLVELATGASNAEIAAKLYLAEGTVKIHVGRILAKLGLRDRVRAVVWAYENRVVRPGRDR